MRHAIRPALAGLALLLAAAPVLAQEDADDMDAGQREYRAACFACHGSGGTGDGPLFPLLNVQVPDLTGLAAANDGEFPMLKVIHIIDGRTGLRGHGSPMPIWGDRFEAEAEARDLGYGTELEVRGRILSIAYYLESIQK